MLCLLKVRAPTKTEQKSIERKDQYDLVNSITVVMIELLLLISFQNCFIVDLLEDIHDQGHKVVGWLAGADRIGEYKKILRAFVLLISEDHDYSPIDKDENGDVLKLHRNAYYEWHRG